MTLGLVLNAQALFHGIKVAENWHGFADDMRMGMCYNGIVNNCIWLFDNLYCRKSDSVI